MDELVKATKRAIAAVPVGHRGNTVLSVLHSDTIAAIARACLSAIESQGMVIVPSRPTEAMRMAMWEAHKIGDAPSGLYDAALAAAPKQG